MRSWRWDILMVAFVAFLIPGIDEADTLSISDTPSVSAKVETVYVGGDTVCAYGKNEILSFADQLYSLGEYDRAAVEYLRFAFLYPEDPCADAALFKAGLCREKSGNYRMARKIYSLLAQSPQQKSQEFGTYRLALTYLLEDKFDSALVYVDTVRNFGAGQYLRGWILLGEQKYRDALEIFSKISDKSDSSDVSGSIDYLITRARQGEKLPRRSPFVAGMLSAIVPGLGRGYCGRWGDAFFSFVVVGAPAGLAYATYEKDKTFSAVMATFAAFFYLGNIYGSAKGAKIYNIEKRQEFWYTTWDEVPHPPTMLYSSYNCSSEGEE